MLPFLIFVVGFALGIAIGLVVRAERGARSTFDLPLPASTRRCLQRKQREARADLRRVLPSRVWWWS